jgi:hypothetical protein
MAEKWNELLDSGYTFFRDISNQLGLKETMTKFKTIQPIQSGLEYLETNENTSEFYKLVKNSSNYNTCKFKYNKELYTLGYRERRNTTFFLFSLMLFIVRGGFRTSIKFYMLMSLLICRENFDLRNYKINASK